MAQRYLAAANIHDVYTPVPAHAGIDVTVVIGAQFSPHPLYPVLMEPSHHNACLTTLPPGNPSRFAFTGSRARDVGKQMLLVTLGLTLRRTFVRFIVTNNIGAASFRTHPTTYQVSLCT